MRYGRWGLLALILCCSLPAEAAEKELVAIIPVAQLDAVTKRVQLIQQRNAILEETLKVRRQAAEMAERESAKQTELIEALEANVRQHEQLRAVDAEALRVAENERKVAEFWRNAAVVGSVVASVHPAFRWVRGVWGR